MQPQVGPASLVRYWKTVAADPELTSTNKCKADATRSNNDDGPISTAMRTNAGDRRVMNINDGAEGMRPQRELLERAFAADPSKADTSMHRTQRAGPKPSFFKRCAAGFLHFGKRFVDSDAESGGTRDAGPEQASLRVLEARTAARAATVNADK